MMAVVENTGIITVREPNIYIKDSQTVKKCWQGADFIYTLKKPPCKEASHNIF